MSSAWANLAGACASRRRGNTISAGSNAPWMSWPGPASRSSSAPPPPLRPSGSPKNIPKSCPSTNAASRATKAPAAPAASTATFTGIFAAASSAPWPPPPPPIGPAKNSPNSPPPNDRGLTPHKGPRRACCLNSDVYWDFCRRIIRAMATALGEHPQLIAWQIDNGLGGHNTEFSFNEQTRRDWQAWLKVKYETIQKLNDRLGPRPCPPPPPPREQP